MKTSLCAKRYHAMTLIEVLVVIMVSMALAALVLPEMLSRPKGYTGQMRCVNNLKQIGLAYRVWASDNNDKFPMEISETNGGTMEFTTGPNAYRHFLVMSNELSTTRVVFCPGESNRMRATNFGVFRNSNLSYFVGVDASQTNPAMILVGDRWLTNDTPVENAMLDLTAKHPARWTAEVHENVGNIVLADGSLQQVNTKKLRKLIDRSGVATNRLQIPILGP
jgi:hypothetical protein